MARTATARAREVQDALVPFLTAYDPSDLPGTSVDPLGFDRGYNFLADQILPGLTNVARLPRYFGLLCAGALLGPDSSSPTRGDVEERQQCVLRLERLWALANVLASDESPLGVRGVRYAESHRNALARDGRRSTGSRFQLLGRQVQYGVLGIYGNVAAGMRLVDRATLGLSGDFGERLGSAFLDETSIPRSVTAAVTDPDREVGLDVLRDWGSRAGVAGKIGKREGSVLLDALRLDPVRSRMADALAATPPKGVEMELARLGRIAKSLQDSDADLEAAIRVIAAFEGCYRWSLLVFERVLWLCGASGFVSRADLSSDAVLGNAATALRESVVRLEARIDAARAPRFRDGVSRMQDVRAFLSGIGSAPGTGDGVACAVLGRHADVQHGKFDRGRRKLPWVEVQGDRVALTLARSSEVRGEPKTADDVRPHEFRTAAADALLAAGGVRP